MQDVTSAFKMCLSTLTQIIVSRKRLILALAALFSIAALISLPAAATLCRQHVYQKWAGGWLAWKNDDPEAALDIWSDIGFSANFCVRPSRIDYWKIRALEKLGREPEAGLLKTELARKYPFDFYTFLLFRDGGAGSLSDACRSRAESLFYPCPWKKEVSAAAARTGVSESMILSVMRQESKFRENAVSRSGAQGLMQLMPSTARDESRSLKMDMIISEIKDPGNNILLGASYFARLSRRFGGDLPRTIAAYNAGMMPVTRWNTLYADDWVEWIEEIPYPETREYVRSVLENREMYKMISGEETGPPISVLTSEGPMPVEKLASVPRQKKSDM